MADPTKVATGLADLAIKVQEKAHQAESNQTTCKILVSIDPGIKPVQKSSEYRFRGDRSPMQNNWEILSK